jgi:hypothetical protein
LSACPSTQNDVTVEKGCKAEIAFRATLATSASGLVLSKMLIFSSFHVAVIADLLSHTCSMVGEWRPYNFRMRVMMVNAAMLPHILALSELISLSLPAVAPNHCICTPLSS